MSTDSPWNRLFPHSPSPSPSLPAEKTFINNVKSTSQLERGQCDSFLTLTSVGMCPPVCGGMFTSSVFFKSQDQMSNTVFYVTNPFFCILWVFFCCTFPHMWHHAVGRKEQPGGGRKSQLLFVWETGGRVNRIDVGEIFILFTLIDAAPVPLWRLAPYVTGCRPGFVHS